MEHSIRLDASMLPTLLKCSRRPLRGGVTVTTDLAANYFRHSAPRALRQ
jgi:hypothetical protein